MRTIALAGIKFVSVPPGVKFVHVPTIARPSFQSPDTLNTEPAAKIVLQIL